MSEAEKIRVMLAQINFIVGDLLGNKKKIFEIADIARINKIDLLVKIYFLMMISLNLKRKF
ncbi:MAG: hypothetical protein ACTSQ5_10850 [Promethearchaeota archaeon]